MLLPLAAFHFVHISGFLRIVPSPEQGTSQSTLSNFNTDVEPSVHYKGHHYESYKFFPLSQVTSLTNIIYMKIWHNSGIMISDNRTRTVQSFRLMNQHITSLIINVIGDHNSSWQKNRVIYFRVFIDTGFRHSNITYKVNHPSKTNEAVQ